MKNIAFGGLFSLLLTLLVAGRAIAVDAAKETSRDGHFIAYDNETVLDTQTNLGSGLTT
jgi:hypothetical protein